MNENMDKKYCRLIAARRKNIWNLQERMLAEESVGTLDSVISSTPTFSSISSSMAGSIIFSSPVGIIGPSLSHDNIEPINSIASNSLVDSGISSSQLHDIASNLLIKTDISSSKVNSLFSGSNENKTVSSSQVDTIVSSTPMSRNTVEVDRFAKILFSSVKKIPKPSPDEVEIKSRRELFKKSPVKLVLPRKKIVIRSGQDNKKKLDPAIYKQKRLRI